MPVPRSGLRAPSPRWPETRSTLSTFARARCFPLGSRTARGLGHLNTGVEEPGMNRPHEHGSEPEFYESPARRRSERVAARCAPLRDRVRSALRGRSRHDPTYDAIVDRIEPVGQMPLSSSVAGIRTIRLATGWRLPARLARGRAVRSWAELRHPMLACNKTSARKHRHDPYGARTGGGATRHRGSS
jgi:hypothetical protein